MPNHETRNTFNNLGSKRSQVMKWPVYATLQDFFHQNILRKMWPRN